MASGQGWSWELAHTRLAIVDVSDAGAQPIANEDGSLVLVFNGEIYNYRELRRYCEQKGHRFSSAMDGEVILHLYEMEGERAFARLNGIFALALASRESGEVVLARDPLGVKPLFHTTGDRELWFASELQALQAAGAPLGRRDLVAEAQFLTFMWVPSPRTPWTGIRALPPGGVLRWRPPGRVTTSLHTDLVGEAIETDVLGAPPAVEEVGDRLSAAVQRQLQSDVPVGLMASGGVDSTLVWMATEGSLDSVFTVSWQGFEQTEGLEADLAIVRKLSAWSGTPLVEVGAPHDASDQPPPSGDLLADPAAELTGALSAAAAERGVKVLLSGQGGDEMFGGYRRHVMAPWLERLPTVPAAARAESLLARASRGRRAAEYAARVLRAAGHRDRFARYLTLCSYSEAVDRAAVLECAEADVSDAVVWAEHRKVYERIPPDWSLLRAGRLLDLTVYLPGLGLTYADRFGMANGIEIRVPFLDLELVRWALRLPDRALSHHREAKPLTKELVATLVSDEVAYRAKQGFGLPSTSVSSAPATTNRSFRQAQYFELATRVLDNATANSGPTERAVRSPSAKRTPDDATMPITPTRVLVNATSARLGGGLSYLRRQIGALERTRPDLDVAVLVSPWNHDAFSAGLTSPLQRVRVPNAWVRYLYEQFVLPRRFDHDQVLYCPGNFGPLRPTRRVVVALQNPNYVGAGVAYKARGDRARRLKIMLSRRSLRIADRVVAISNSLAADLLRDMPEVADKTRIVLSGAPAWPEEGRRPDAPIGDGGHVLSLANDYAHKNLDHVLDAWVEAFGNSEPRAVPHLVFVGTMSPRRRRAQLDRIPVELADRVVHLGGVADRREVRWLVEHAAVMVAPSALEAFPLTPAEAGALGCPLILSDIPAHREVAGEHPTYVPVDDIAGLARAIRHAVEQPPERTPWTWPVSWEDNARQLAAIFDELASDTPPRRRRTRRRQRGDQLLGGGSPTEVSPASSASTNTASS